MAKKKQQEQDHTEEKKDQELLAQIPQEEEQQEPEKVSAMDAVRSALGEGIEKPGEIADYVKQRFSLEVNTKTISVYKSQIKKKEEGGEGSTTTRTRRTSQTAANEPTLADLMRVKELVEQKDSVEGFQKQLTELDLVAQQVGGFANLKKCLDALVSLGVK